MSALLGLGIAGLASGMIGNLMNQSNFNEQMDFSRYQYEDMKRRQDPVYQVNQLRAAGLNPALNAGNVQLAQASSASQPSPPNIQGYDLSGLSALGNGLDLNALTGANIESQTAKNDAEAQGINIDNLFRAEDWKSKIYGRDMQSWLNDQLSQVAKLDVEYNKNSIQYRVEQQRQQMALLQSQVAAQDLANVYFPVEASERISKIIAEKFAAYATGQSSLAMAHQGLMRLFAEVGSNPKERSDFFNATLQNLKQQRFESMSREWSNVNSKSPLPYNRNTRQEYFDWRDTGYYKPQFGR